MKITLFLVAVILLYGCTKQNKAIISARIDNAGKTVAYVIEADSTDNKIIDSVKIKKNGEFKFSIPILSPGYYYLKFKENIVLTLILSPGEEVNLTADFNNFYKTKDIAGSANSIRVNYLHDSLRSAIAILEKIKADYSKIIELDKDTAMLSKMSEEYKNVIEKYHKFSVGYILEDIKSLANIDALFQEYAPGNYVFNKVKDLQYYKIVSDTLGKYYPNVKQVQMLNSYYKAFYESYQIKRMMNLAKSSDSHLPDISLADKKGIYRKLSSLRGKIVLLTFWSINNEECIEENANFQKVYKKFKAKGFEIYQVSIDNSTKTWQNALSIEKLPWISVCDTVFMNSPTRGYYNVNAIPLNYLINADQTELLGKNLSASELDQKLTELF
jgi:thiol-disulfide isomerase/thioredoxin